MITKLTAEQTAKFPEYVKYWTDVGLCTTPADRARAEEGIRLVYRNGGHNALPHQVWCGSPMSAALTRAIVLDLVKKGQLGASVRDSVRDSVGDSVWASVRDSVRDSGYGQHDANWIGFFAFFRHECGLKKETEKLLGLMEVCQTMGWFLPHEKICWNSERHCALYRNTEGRLHKDGAMALEYPDGWGIYALNGVRVKPEYVLTPAEKISPETVLGETNAEVRRELLRKIGVERFLSVAKHRTLDRQGDYELLSIELSPEVRDARYLKMLNPSIEVWHVEAVHPDCKTVQHALNFRAALPITDKHGWTPEVLT